MRYIALATDYDGTLAHDGRVDAPTLDALDRLKASGRRLILVTGRELDDLSRTFEHVGRFDRVVAENGALVYDPATRKETLLAQPPPADFVEKLRKLGAQPLSAGRVIVATREPWERATLDVIRDSGLELQVIFNKGAVMVLPTGVNKATGLKCALEDLGLSARNLAGIGDAENDHAFLAMCECSVAVANALPALKDRADIVTSGARGEGVRELIDGLLHDDLASVDGGLRRHDISLGRRKGEDVKVPVYGSRILVAGSSGGGKSTLTTGFLERLSKADYQFCAVDPEGDYQTFPGAVVIGDAKAAPVVDEVLSVLEKPGRSVVVNLVGVRVDDRVQYFEKLLGALGKLRDSTSRPHWLVVDEAHHVLPAAEDSRPALPDNMFLITLEPDRLHRDVLARMTHLLTVGEHPADAIHKFCSSCGHACPDVDPGPLEHGEAILYRCGSDHEPLLFDVAEAETKRVRHSRKYATAELTPDRSFYFRGAEGKLNLRAQNLMVFLQMLDGVDDKTWTYHLKRREYSQWFRDNIKDQQLAAEAEQAEQSGGGAAETKAAIRAAVEQRYTLPV